MGAKQGVLALVVVFLGFWMFTDPSGLAEVAQSAAESGWDVLVQGFEGVIRFLGELG